MAGVDPNKSEPTDLKADRATTGESRAHTTTKTRKMIVFAAYRQMLITVLSALFIIIILLLVMYFGSKSTDSKNGPYPSIVLSVIVCGALGAMFSAATRLYTFKDLPIAVIDKSATRLGSIYLFAYSILPILIGAISAAVIYIAFASGLIKGPMFPEMSCQLNPAPCDDYASLIWKYGPKSAEEYAKALMWGFIAGFAERLVPDALQRLATKAGDEPSQDTSKTSE